MIEQSSRGTSEGQLACIWILRGAHSRLSVFDHAKDLMAAFNQILSGAGQRDLPSIAMKQFDTETFLKFTDVLACGRLRDEQDVAGAREATRLGYGAEDLQLAKVDGHDICYCTD